MSLLDAINAACANAAWSSLPDGTTYCNYFCQQIAHACGINDLDQSNGAPFLAADMGPHLRELGWQEISKEDAQARANNGEFVLAWAGAPEGEHHGHVAVISPGEMEASSSFGCLVPLCASISKYPFQNRIGRVSEFFRAGNKPAYLARSAT